MVLGHGPEVWKVPIDRPAIVCEGCGEISEDRQEKFNQFTKTLAA